MVVNIQDAQKFTLGQKITVLVSHTVFAVLDIKGGHWLSPQKFLKYQGTVVEHDNVELTLLIQPLSSVKIWGIQCMMTVWKPLKQRIRAILKESPIKNTENWFMDGSSYS